MIEITQPRFGYRVHYRAGEANHCPSCGKTQWMVGRLTAECAFCATAIPICTAGMTGPGLFRAEPRQPAPISLAA